MGTTAAQRLWMTRERRIEQMRRAITAEAFRQAIEQQRAARAPRRLKEAA